MTEEMLKSILHVVKELGLPVVLVGIFIVALWMRTNSFIAFQREFAERHERDARAMCEKQLDVLEEIRDLLRGKP